MSATAGPLREFAAELRRAQLDWLDRAAIEQWLRSTPRPTPPKEVEDAHGEVIGRFSPVTATGVHDITDATTSRIVLLPDSSMPDGYRILTSYPRP